MSTETKTLADQLVDELQKTVRLLPSDARKAAFVALALRANWSKSKISNYLGVSRARVSQKVEKLEHYVDPRVFRDRMPALTQVMNDVSEIYQTQYERGREENDYARFDAESWEDEEFADSLLKLVLKKGDEKVNGID